MNKIPSFNNEEQAFEWYESHDITDHLGDTKELSCREIFYQDSGGLWHVADTGMVVSVYEERDCVITGPYFSEEQIVEQYASSSIKHHFCAWESIFYALGDMP